MGLRGGDASRKKTTTPCETGCFLGFHKTAWKPDKTENTFGSESRSPKNPNPEPANQVLIPAEKILVRGFNWLGERRMETTPALASGCEERQAGSDIAFADKTTAKLRDLFGLPKSIRPVDFPVTPPPPPPPPGRFSS